MKMVTAAEFLTRASQSYSMMVATERAIPRVSDGLKSAQRIAIWCMRNRSDKIKVSALSGEMVASNLYVHGDAQGVISNIAGPFVNNVPIFDGEGNFGSLMHPKAFGAGRYTYVVRSKFMEEIFLADKNLYEMIPSVDGDAEMCDTFLPLVPSILLNGAEGIAVGWSTDILPYKLNDLRDQVISRLQGKEPKKLIPYFEAYNTVTVEELENNRDNATSFRFSGRVHKVNTTTCEITAIPPGISIESVQEHLDNLIDDKKIISYDNHSTTSIKIIVKIWRNDLASLDEEQLIDLFKLRTRKTQRLVTVDFDGRRIRVFKDTKDLIDKWVEWRFSFITKRYIQKLKDISEELAFHYAVRKVHNSDIISRLTSFKTKKSLVDEIINVVSATSDIANKISSFPSFRWTEEENAKNEKIIAELEKDYETTNAIAKSEDLQKAEWVKDLKKIK